MRTTIVLREELAKQLAHLASSKKLSAFINECISEYFARQEKEKKLKVLEERYAAAAKGSDTEFSAIEVEDWPDW